MKQSPESLLKERSLKLTPGRINLLSLLMKEVMPRTVEELHKSLKSSINEVTLYRTLETFEVANLVRKVELGHGHAHYELIPGRAHHHHIICTSCGAIEDIDVRHSTDLEKEARKLSKNFSSITRYSLEFFGLCKRCSR
jgi:Fe2+ or Zn2+ uptake regulation protein